MCRTHLKQMDSIVLYMKFRLDYSYITSCIALSYVMIWEKHEEFVYRPEAEWNSESKVVWFDGNASVAVHSFPINPQHVNFPLTHMICWKNFDFTLVQIYCRRFCWLVCIASCRNQIIIIPCFSTYTSTAVEKRQPERRKYVEKVWSEKLVFVVKAEM